jgi:hypothetical protein
MVSASRPLPSVFARCNHCWGRPHQRRNFATSGAESVSCSQVPIENVLSLHDVREVYTVPEMLEKQVRACAPPVGEHGKQRTDAAQTHRRANAANIRLRTNARARANRLKRCCIRAAPLLGRAADPFQLLSPACPREAWPRPGCRPAGRPTSPIGRPSAHARAWAIARLSALPKLLTEAVGRKPSRRLGLVTGYYSSTLSLLGPAGLCFPLRC